MPFSIMSGRPGKVKNGVSPRNPVFKVYDTIEKVMNDAPAGMDIAIPFNPERYIPMP